VDYAFVLAIIAAVTAIIPFIGQRLAYPALDVACFSLHHGCYSKWLLYGDGGAV